MKIAFCLFGIIGGVGGKDGTGGNIEYSKCFERYNEEIFQKYDTDVFIHTWSVNYEKPIKRIYQPKSSIFEPQIQFHHKDDPFKDKFRSCSRWYSTQKVLELQREYSETNNIQYDFIMLARFDLIWLTSLDFTTLEKDCFYVANWNLHPKDIPLLGKKANASFPEGKLRRYSDMWFIGNQEQMDYLSGIYDVIDKIGDKEYNQHLLVYDRMYPKYKDKIKFKYYNSFDFALYRKYLTGDYR